MGYELWVSVWLARSEHAYPVSHIPYRALVDLDVVVLDDLVPALELGKHVGVEIGRRRAETHWHLALREQPFRIQLLHRGGSGGVQPCEYGLGSTYRGENAVPVVAADAR